MAGTSSSTLPVYYISPRCHHLLTGNKVHYLAVFSFVGFTAGPHKIRVKCFNNFWNAIVGQLE